MGQTSDSADTIAQKDRPNLVLLPGIHGTDDLWPPLLAAIPADWPTTIIRYPPTDCLSPQQLLALIGHSIPARPPLILIAESFSGPLAIEFAAQNPDRVRAVVLCATYILPPTPAWLCRAGAIIARWGFKPIMRLRRYIPNRLADATLGRVDRDALRHLTPAVLASRLKIVAETDCGRALAAYPGPILYLAGRRDFVVRNRSIRRLQALRPTAEAHTLDCSHMVLQRRPAQAWQHIQRFISQLPQSANPHNPHVAPS